MVNVYAIQEVSGKNYLPAADYGEIKFLVPPKTNIMFSSEDTVNKIKEGLQQFNSEDYILLVGDPICIGVATYYAANKSQKVKFLKWDNREFKYFPVTIDFK
jgi:hypothetical protein